MAGTPAPAPAPAPQPAGPRVLTLKKLTPPPAPFGRGLPAAQMKACLTAALLLPIPTSGENVDSYGVGFGLPVLELIDLVIQYAVSPLVVRHVAGSGRSGFADGVRAEFSFPSDLLFVNRPGTCFPSKPSLVVLSGGRTIRMIDISTRLVSTIAGTAGVSGSNDGPLSASTFNTLQSICYSKSRNSFFVSASTNIRQLDPTGQVTTLCGSGVAGYRDGIGLDAAFNGAASIVVGESTLADTLFVADRWNNCVRRVDLATRRVTTFGGGGPNITGKGIIRSCSSLAFQPPTPDAGGPTSIKPDSVLFFIDWRLSRVVIDTVEISAVAENVSGDSMVFISPHQLIIAAPGSSSIFMLDVRKPEYTLLRLTGTGFSSDTGYRNGVAASALWNVPQGLSFVPAAGDGDGVDRLYVCDRNNHCIREISGHFSLVG